MSGASILMVTSWRVAAPNPPSAPPSPPPGGGGAARGGGGAPPPAFAPPPPARGERVREAGGRGATPHCLTSQRRRELPRHADVRHRVDAIRRDLEVEDGIAAMQIG